MPWTRMWWNRRRSIVATASVLVGCASPVAPKAKTPATDVFLPRALTNSEQVALQASNSFGFTLFARINTATRTENQFISPLSASMALAMVANGAAGTTWTEMRSTLGLGTTTQAEMRASYHDLIAVLRALDPKVDFRIANAIWVSSLFSSAIDPTYLTQSQQAFDARVGTLDFLKASSVDTVNAWASAATAGKIPSIVQSLPADLVMLLANAMYFKGDWRTTFEMGGTHMNPFTLLDGSKTSVPMMQRTGTMRLGDLGGRQMVELGYGGDAFVMDAVKPKAGETVNDLAESLSAATWSAGLATFADTLVELAMPRFKLEWERTLNGELSAMGMPTAFTPAADFTAASPTMGRKMFISFVKQKTFVDVNETGTVAAAVTSVGVTAVSGRFPPPVSVTLDRPFIFVIRERITGAILFMGKVVRPA